MMGMYFGSLFFFLPFSEMCVTLFAGVKESRKILYPYFRYHESNLESSNADLMQMWCLAQVAQIHITHRVAQSKLNYHKSLPIFFSKKGGENEISTIGCTHVG